MPFDRATHRVVSYLAQSDSSITLCTQRGSVKLWQAKDDLQNQTNAMMKHKFDYRHQLESTFSTYNLTMVCLMWRLPFASELIESKLRLMSRQKHYSRVSVCLIPAPARTSTTRMFYCPLNESIKSIKSSQL